MHWVSRSLLFPREVLCGVLLWWVIFNVANAEFNIPTIAFDEGYTPLFGDTNLVRSTDGEGVSLLLDRFTGSGFISSKMYKYGFFSASIRLPGNHTAGLCVAFYASNGDVFEKNHDELDFEFLGNVEGKAWRFQTNVYGNGSTNRGREERYTLWFDPSKGFHRYTILWTARNILFFVDDVPIREVVRNEAMGGDYPSKPMQLYSTIWDASSWATAGGKKKVNYKYAPFVSEFRGLSLDGCVVDLIDENIDDGYCTESELWSGDSGYSVVSLSQRTAMMRFRRRHIYYSYCYDLVRYPIPPSECVIDPLEKEMFKDTGRLKFGGSHPRRRRSRRRRGSPVVSDDVEETL